MLSKELEKYGVTYTGIVENDFISKILSWVLPVLLFFVLWMYVFRRIAEKGGMGGMGGLLQVGKSKAKIHVEKGIKVTFDDVAGVDEAKAELREVVHFLKEPGAYSRLVARALPGVDAVQKISIIPRGIGALGYTIQRPTEDRYLMTREELENKMAVLLGGRAAEMLVFGKLSTGAADDLNKATDIARNMVMRYGMDETLGQAIYAEERPRFLDGTVQMPTGGALYSPETAREIDCAVRALIDHAFARASAILKRHRDALEDVAQKLLERETLTGDELPSLPPEPGAEAAE